ncbi:Tar ligand binding domain-containing protein (plasmid) [Devosia sp. A8/3-2]|nr:Tar ligand binding domain-containing protein [Devosia sp. A8/3-2]
MFSRISVATRIFAAFGALILILSGIGLVGYYGVSSIAGTFESYRHAARETLELSDYTNDLIDLRLSADAFFVSRDRFPMTKSLPRSRTSALSTPTAMPSSKGTRSLLVSLPNW